MRYLTSQLDTYESECPIFGVLDTETDNHDTIARVDAGDFGWGGGGDNDTIALNDAKTMAEHIANLLNKGAAK